MFVVRQSRSVFFSGATEEK